LYPATVARGRLVFCSRFRNEKVSIKILDGLINLQTVRYYFFKESSLSFLFFQDDGKIMESSPYITLFRILKQEEGA